MKRSAGLLLYRHTAGIAGGLAALDGTLGSVGDPDHIEVLLGHSGGPLYRSRSEGAWSIPKGEYLPDEPALDAARREFTEELGLPVPDGPLVALGEIRQRSGKLVTAWALHAELDPDSVTPGTFTMQWPPKSGRWQDFPELDRVAWWGLAQARTLMVAGQSGLLDLLVAALRLAE